MRVHDRWARGARRIDGEAPGRGAAGRGRRLVNKAQPRVAAAARAPAARRGAALTGGGPAWRHGCNAWRSVVYMGAAWIKATAIKERVPRNLGHT